MRDRLGQCGTYSAELSGPNGELRTPAPTWSPMMC